MTMVTVMNDGDDDGDDARGTAGQVLEYWSSEVGG